jgi:GNAT superfamily N-acetyltransferase
MGAGPGRGAAGRRPGARAIQTGVIIEFELRVADVSDRSAVFGLLKSAAAWLRERNIDYWQNWLEPPTHHVRWVDDGLAAGEFRVLESDGQVIGCVRVQGSDRLFWGADAGPAGYVHSLTVDRSRAGHGIGAQTLDMLGCELAAAGIGLLRLDCGERATGLRRYYESLGFRPVGTTVVDGESLVLYERSTWEGAREELLERAGQGEGAARALTGR